RTRPRTWWRRAAGAAEPGSLRPSLRERDEGVAPVEISVRVPVVPVLPHKAEDVHPVRLQDDELANSGVVAAAVLAHAETLLFGRVHFGLRVFSHPPQHD